MTFLNDKTKRMSIAVAMVLVMGIGASGCATPPKDDPEAMAAFEATNDPYEPLNRSIFSFNLALDKAVLRPIAYVYKEAVPATIRGYVRNFMDNLRSPVILANDLLQGEFDRAGDTLVRFVMNSTLGIGGINDLAGEVGVPRHDEDFGQTMAVWGVNSGPYLMLPFLGPSSPRQAVGFLVDLAFDPFTYYGEFEWGAGRFLMRAVDNRAVRYDAIDELERTSLDFYAAVRSLHRQLRKDEINNGVEKLEQQPLPEMSFSPLRLEDPLAQPKLSMAD